MLPFLEVSHLPSSSSFYSAVTQPLGLRYISSSDSGSGSGPCITFGTAQSPVFQLKQVPVSTERPLHLSRLVLTAASSQAVDDFHANAERAAGRSSARTAARPALTLVAGSSADNHHGDEAETASRISGSQADTALSTTRVSSKIIDLDGNVMEVVYLPPSGYPSKYEGSTVRKTQSTVEEASRIMDWNYDVATSSGRSVAPSVRHTDRYAEDDQPYAMLRRSHTTSAFPEPRMASATAETPRQSTGLSTGAVVGTLLGVAAAGAAAGAALTYTVLKNERIRAPAQEFDPPPFAGRSTFPEPFPEQRGRYIQVERSVEKVRYPEDEYDYGAGPARQSPPRYLTQYSQSGRPAPSRAGDEVYDDTASRHSSRYRAPSTIRPRTRSEASSSRRPLMLTDGADQRSYISSAAPSKHSSARPPLSTHGRSMAYHHDDDADVDARSAAAQSYASGRSRRSSTSTLRPPTQVREAAHSAAMVPLPASVQTSVSSRYSSSKPASRVSVSTVKMACSPPSHYTHQSVGGGGGGRSQYHSQYVPAPSVSGSSRTASRANSYMTARQVPLPASIVGGSSHMSARHVPLPGSAVGSSRAGWQDDGDTDSILPSDSISQIGSRPARSRVYH